MARVVKATVNLPISAVTGDLFVGGDDRQHRDFDARLHTRVVLTRIIITSGLQDTLILLLFTFHFISNMLFHQQLCAKPSVGAVRHDSWSACDSSYLLNKQIVVWPIICNILGTYIGGVAVAVPLPSRG